MLARACARYTTGFLLCTTMFVNLCDFFFYYFYYCTGAHRVVKVSPSDADMYAVFFFYYAEYNRFFVQCVFEIVVAPYTRATTTMQLIKNNIVCGGGSPGYLQRKLLKKNVVLFLSTATRAGNIIINYYLLSQAHLNCDLASEKFLLSGYLIMYVHSICGNFILFAL